MTSSRGSAGTLTRVRATEHTLTRDGTVLHLSVTFKILETLS